MTLVDLLSILIIVVCGLVGLRSGFLSSIKLLISLVVSYLVSIFTLNPLLKLLEGFGLRENLFSPIIIFVFLIIIFWGAVYALEMTVFSGIDKKIRWIGVLPGLVVGLAICHIAFIVLFGLVGQDKIMQESRICPLFMRENMFGFFNKRPFISREEAVDGKLIVTKQEKEVIMIYNLPDLASASSDMENQMFTMINEYRKENGFEGLQKDSYLDALAQKYSEEILRSKRFSHLDSSLQMPEDRAEKEKIKFNYIGENLAIAPTLASAHKGITDSSAHRENLLQPLFRRIGISVLKLNTGSVLVVQEFSN